MGYDYGRKYISKHTGLTGLESLGYKVNSKVLEAIKYGAPQIRERLFVIGSKYKISNFFPELTIKEPNFFTLISPY